MSDITKKYVDYAGLQEYDSQIKSVISTDFVGATSSTDGAAGRVPAPDSGDENKFLRGDGTWSSVAVSGSVTGVKGDSELTYRDGNVNITKDNIGLGNVGNFKAVSTVASQGLSTTEQANARANIGAGTSSFDGAYSSLSGKPTLGTAAEKDVATSGNAGNTQVVMGNDTRLSDSRPASDVSSWAKASSKPSYTASEVGAIPSTDKGANSGVATLTSSGKLTDSQIPTTLKTIFIGTPQQWTNESNKSQYTIVILTD